MTNIEWKVGMSVDLKGRMDRYVFKRAKQLQAGDTIYAYNGGARERSTIFSVGTMPGERGKPMKAQHMGTGNLAVGVHVVFLDGAEALLHPDEQIEVIR